MKKKQAPSHTEIYLDPPSLVVEFKEPQIASSLHMLPREILEVILQYLDGYSMVQLSSTCGLFYNLVNEIASWKMYVMNVDFEHLKDNHVHFGAPRFFPPGLKRPFPWKSIFYSFHLWKSLPKWKFFMYHMEVAAGQICSVNIAGQTVVCGTQLGKVVLCNPDDDTGMFKLISTTSAAVDTVLVQLHPDFELEHLPYRIIVHCVDTSLFVYDMQGYIISCGRSILRDLRNMSSSGDNLYEWDPQRGTGAHTFIQKDILKRCADLVMCNFLEPFGPFVAVDISEQSSTSRKNCTRPKRLLNDASKFFITRAYIWPGRISLSTTINHMTIISVGSKCTIVNWPITFKCISASLFANVLIVGTNHGQVLFYTFHEPLDLLELDPSVYTKRIETGLHEPIIYVGVRVQNYLHALPDIVAASRSKLVLCRVTK